MAKSDLTAINAKTISVNGTPIAGSVQAYGPYTTFDQLDADVVVALNGTVIQGMMTSGLAYTNIDHLNVLSGLSVAETVRYGTASTPASNNATGPIGIGGGAVPLPGGGGTPTPTPGPTPTPSPTPTPTPTYPTITPRDNLALSWHEMDPVMSADGSHVDLLASDGTGVMVAYRIEATTGRYTAEQVMTPKKTLQDDHLAFSRLNLSSGAALRWSVGHADRYVSGAAKNELIGYRNPDGNNWEGWPTDRAGAIVITLNSAFVPNYAQLKETPDKRVTLLYNDDTSLMWRYYHSTDQGQTYSPGPINYQLGSGWGGAAQLYMREDIDGQFTGTIPGGTTGTFVRHWIFIHPGQTQAPLRMNWMEVNTGVIYNGVTGAVVASGKSAYTGAQGTMVPVNATATPSLPDIRVPATGRTQRITKAKAGTVYIVDMLDAANATPFGDARHVINKEVGGVRTDFDIGAAGVPFWTSSGYMPDLQPGSEPVSGEVIYRCVNNGVVYNAGSKLLRHTYPNGVENGNPTIQTVFEAGVTPGIAANEAILRYFPVRGAKATGVVGFAWVVTTYTSYTQWTGGRFVPIVR